MVKFIAVAAVMAFAVGLIRVNFRSTSDRPVAEVASNAIPANSSAERPEDSSRTQTVTSDEFSENVDLLKSLEISIGKRNREYEDLIAEINKLTARLGEGLCAHCTAVT